MPAPAWQELSCLTPPAAPLFPENYEVANKLDDASFSWESPDPCLLCLEGGISEAVSCFSSIVPLYWALKTNISAIWKLCSGLCGYMGECKTTPALISCKEICAPLLGDQAHSADGQFVREG